VKVAVVLVGIPVESTQLWDNLNYMGKKTIRPFVVNIFRALNLSLKANKKYFTINMVLILMQGVFPVIEVAVAKYVLDSVGTLLTTTVISGEEISAVIFWVAVELGVVLCSFVANTLKNTIQKIFGDIVQTYALTSILEKASSLDAAFFENDLFYDKLSKARQGAIYRPVIVLQLCFEIIQSLVSIIGYMAILIFFSPLILIVILVSSLPLLLMEIKYSKRIYKIYENRVPEVREKEYYCAMLTDKWPFKEIKHFELHDFFISIFKSIAYKHIAQDIEILNKKNFAAVILNALLTFLYYGAYGFVIFIAIVKKITIGSFVMYTRIIKQIQESFKIFLNAAARLYEENLYLTNLFSFLDFESTLPNGNIKKNGDGAFVKKAIEFRNVSFTYPGTDKLVLRNLNLKIAPGINLALVGLNGSGKTTLVKLLCRFYDPTEGDILIDDINIKDYDISYLRNNISTIFQDYLKYEMSVRNNIGLGSLAHMDNIDKIKEAASKSEAHEFIQKLAAGYNEKLGRTLFKGTELSIGQWQKIALSRAFMRESEILILDEPTAALDAEAEYMLFKKYKELMLHKISILISHRFSTVRMCDRIAVLKDGCIIEQGSHEELMNKNGEYARLFNLQAESYIKDSVPARECVS
jgi:ABC-type multidrug transport system fused ATPase/permease subunit